MMIQAAVNAEMHGKIRDRLCQIEDEENVKILFAIESGSRAWGFHSPDSDYDVRFVYARPRDWHYRLQKKRDVIERPIDDELDLSGWELSKALRLAIKSNAVITEWLQSPIVYIAEPDAVSRLSEFARAVLDRRAVTWHYLALRDRQLSRLKGPEGGMRIKRYFYVLRPTLALRWMRLTGQAMPPMDMKRLRDGCDLAKDVSDALDRLTKRKMAVIERAETEATDPVLDVLIASEADAARIWLADRSAERADDHWAAANALHMDLSPKCL